MIELPIETKRLVLRRFKVSDAEALHRYLSNPDVYLFEPGHPVSLDEALKLCEERAEFKGFIAVSLKGTDELIGHLSFFQAEPAYVNTYELGFIFNPAFQRRGFCTEAAAALVNAAFNSGHAHRIEARCDVLNKASWRVLEKAGFIREGLMRKQIYFRKDDNGQPIWVNAYLYAILAEDVVGH